MSVPAWVIKKWRMYHISCCPVVEFLLSVDWLLQYRGRFAEKKSSSVKSIAAVAANSESFDDSDMIQVVVVDGCEKCCAYKILKGKNLTAKISFNSLGSWY